MDYALTSGGSSYISNRINHSPQNTNTVNRQNFVSNYNQPQTYASTNPTVRNSPSSTQPALLRQAPIIVQSRFSDTTEPQIQCGVPSRPVSGTTGLVVNGQVAVKGQFPWLAAYYHNGVNDNGFICGGSLISSKAVITAAHCVHSKRDVQKKAEEAIFYIGKYYIGSFANEKDFIISPVLSFIIHPDWNSQADSYDGDIAIANLLRNVQFSDFVKPICLWTSTTNYYDLINHHGVIAGYGKTQFTSSTSDKPYWTALPVVDEGTCLRSNTDFTKITSRRTFCVGSRDGRGPCNGK